MKNRIKELRHQNNLSQVKLAELCGCHSVTIKKLENHQVDSIKFHVLQGLCKALKCPLDRLFRMEDKDNVR